MGTRKTKSHEDKMNAKVEDSTAWLELLQAANKVLTMHLTGKTRTSSEYDEAMDALHRSIKKVEE
jgi:hypothetical protein